MTHRILWFQYLSLNAVYLGTSFMWNIIHPIVLPLLLLNYGSGQTKNTRLGMLTFAGYALGMIVQPLAGALSDRTQHRLGRRRPWVFYGGLVAILSLLLLAVADSFWALAVAYLALQVASNAVMGPSHGLIPDALPEGKRGLAIGLRIAALALAVFVWLYTTDAGSLVLSLVALGLPYTWGLTAGMALRYLPTMAGVFRSISEAQQARALDLHAGGLVQRARAYIPISVAMLISALRTAQSVSYGLESRALGATPRRTYLHRLHLRPVDIVYAVLLFLLTAAYLYARLALGLGTQPLGLWR